MFTGVMTEVAFLTEAVIFAQQPYHDLAAENWLRCLASPRINSGEQRGARRGRLAAGAMRGSVKNEIDVRYTDVAKAPAFDV
jgi:hypothetical protein